MAGCEKSPPPVTDPAKAPWLLDPQSQIDGLQNSDFRIRGLSAFNLGNMGDKAAETIPALEKIAQSDPNPKVRENARGAIEKIKSASDQSAQ
jgi:HEAT repeat protein